MFCGFHGHQKNTNEWVLQAAGTERHLLKSVKKRKITCFGHIMRKKNKCLGEEIIQGTTPGARARGRPKTSWLGNLRLWTGLTMEGLLRTVEERQGWKIVVHDAINPRTEDD